MCDQPLNLDIKNVKLIARQTEQQTQIQIVDKT
jgi:hypothetical protein